MRKKVNQLCMELLSIARPTNLSDTAEQVLLDGHIGFPERRRRRLTSADQRETDEAWKTVVRTGAPRLPIRRAQTQGAPELTPDATVWPDVESLRLSRRDRRSCGGNLGRRALGVLLFVAGVVVQTIGNVAAL